LWKEPKPEARSDFCGLAPGHSPRSHDRKGLAWRTECHRQLSSKGQEESRGVKRTHTLEKEGPVIKFIGFQQGAEESIRLRCLNDPRPGGRAAQRRERGGGSAPEWYQRET
jgi:hypothetical protein